MPPFNVKQTTRLLMNTIYMIKEYCEEDCQYAQQDKELAIDMLQNILSLKEDDFCFKGVDLEDDKANGTLLPF